ncbi:hypothetical protein, partial [Alloacidobacterium sp.]|uniref:hypothetical protein n=1 Tax=Alloacidobacterium sp. TaxID=2951999 RepID=UPI002D266A6D
PDVRLRWAGVGVLLVLLSALGWFVWHYVSNRVATANIGVHQPLSALGSNTLAVSSTVQANSGN